MSANIYPFVPAEAGTQDWFAPQLQLWIPACGNERGLDR